MKFFRASGRGTFLLLLKKPLSRRSPQSAGLWGFFAGKTEVFQGRAVREGKSVFGDVGAGSAADPIAWTQQMNNISAKAEESVRAELIYS